MKQQTAIEWLVEQLKINNYINDNAHWLIDDAKEMFKQQIKDAFNKSTAVDENNKSWSTAEQYFKETFNK